MIRMKAKSTVYGAEGYFKRGELFDVFTAARAEDLMRAGRAVLLAEDSVKPLSEKAPTDGRIEQKILTAKQQGAEIKPAASVDLSIADDKPAAAPVRRQRGARRKAAAK